MKTKVRKDIKINEENWEKLMAIKLNKKLKNMDQVIEFLLERFER
jgi:hypothetical protein